MLEIVPREIANLRALSHGVISFYTEHRAHNLLCARCSGKGLIAENFSTDASNFQIKHFNYTKYSKKSQKVKLAEEACRGQTSANLRPTSADLPRSDLGKFKNV